MDKKIFLIVFVSFLAVSHGFGLREILDYLVGGGNYGSYYPGYPSGPNYGNYPGNYPEHHGPPGPPGDHPGCPLCDSSVYSYCSYKEAHDSCCCNPSFSSYNCRKSDCSFLYANSCQEFNLISSCCCVDLQKNAIEPAAV